VSIKIITTNNMAQDQDNYQIITLKTIDSAKLIHDVVIRPLKVFSDPRGYLAEVLKTNWSDVYQPDKLPFSQSYVSWTNFNVARDENLFHYHPNGQQDRFVILKGQAVVVVYDQRSDSPTKGVLNLFVMDGLDNPDNSYMLVVPPYTLHGFLTTAKEGTMLINFPSHLYDPANEQRLAFDQYPLPDGSVFSWHQVRQLIGLPVPDKPVTK